MPTYGFRVHGIRQLGILVWKNPTIGDMCTKNGFIHVGMSPGIRVIPFYFNGFGGFETTETTETKWD